MTFFISPITQHSCFTEYYMSQDGEGDDIQALVIAAEAMKKHNIQVNCTIGNPEIRHAENESREMSNRVNLANEIFGKKVASAGARDVNEISEDYVKSILSESDKKSLILHTESFKSLRALFERSQPNQLKNTVIVAYGSVNMTWTLSDLADYRSFYESLEKSGATLIQIDAFPFIGTRNVITHKNTPLTHSLLDYLDGSAGLKWTQVNNYATDKVRAKQADKIANFIQSAFATTSDLKKEQICHKLSEILALFNFKSKPVIDLVRNSQALQEALNRTLKGEAHDFLQNKLQEMKEILLPILKFNESDFNRVFNIYHSTTLHGQGLISDQIPAIIFSELVEKRKGIAEKCVSVQFEGLEGRFAQYTPSKNESSLYYLNTKEKLKIDFGSQQQCKQQESIEVDSYLAYMDLCIASALLANNKTISKETKQRLFSNDLKEKLLELAQRVEGMGYELPKCYYTVIDFCF